MRVRATCSEEEVLKLEDLPRGSVFEVEGGKVYWKVQYQIYGVYYIEIETGISYALYDIEGKRVTKVYPNATVVLNP
jgi:hypothetical protein